MNVKGMVLAACVAALGTAAHADGHAGKVKVGMITTLSGGGAGLGIDVRDGFLLATKGSDALEVVIEQNSATSGNICDAIITQQPGDITFPIMHRVCGPGLVVSEDEALQAMAQAFLRLKLVAEPDGAVALAAAICRQNSLGLVLKLADSH